MNSSPHCRFQLGTQPGKNHLHWLDWLRFTAALMVVFVHARGGNWVEWGRLEEASRTEATAVFFALTRIGSEWVTVFFVLSGFLVGGKVLERVMAKTFDVRAYAIDRFSRIWVPLIPSLLFTMVVALYLGRPVSAVDFFGCLLGLQTSFCENFGRNVPLWSLAYEIWFYLLAGCVAVIATSRSRARLWAYLGIAIGFVVFTRLEVVFLFCWLLGALSYGFRFEQHVGRLAAVGVAMVIAGCVCSQLNLSTVSLDTRSLKMLVPSPEIATLILSFGLALIVPLLPRLQPATVFLKKLDRMGSRLAAFSYTLYLTHYPVLAIWEKLTPERHFSISFLTVMLYFIKILSCLVFAWLLYLPFEAQTAALRKWLHRRFDAGQC